MSLCEKEIFINLNACRNLRSSRSVESFTVFGQVSLGKTTLGDSTRLEYKVPTEKQEEEEGEGEEPEVQLLNYEVKHTIEIANPIAIEEIIRNPLLVSMYEVLPKDKRAKEEKTHLLGIGSIDLLPLTQGQTSIEHTLKLKPLTPSSSSEEIQLPEVDVVITVARSSLLTPDDIQNSNILSWRIKGLYSLPENWSPSSNVSITVATPRPHHLDIADDATGISLPGGEIKTPGDIDLAQSMQKWKWADLNSSTTGLASLTDHVLEANAIEDESGQLSTSEDIEFRRNAESRKNKVVWNSELRIYLDPKANSTFLQQLSSSSIWPIEVLRISSASSGRAKSKEDDTTYTHHGVAYTDLSSLLYPGVTRVFGAYCIEGMSESDMAEKTKHVHAKNVMEYFYRTPSGKRARKGSATAARASVISLAGAPQQQPTDAHLSAGDSIAYNEAKTYILMEMELAKPLVPKRPASVIADKISEYIVPHPPLPRKISGVEKAVRDFHSSTVDVAGLVLADYRSLFGEAYEKEGKLPYTLEERKRQLLYSLNTSGHYHAYKEHMKRSVVSIVRERFLNDANTNNEAEMQAFLSRLYTYLVDEMHVAMRKVFSLEESPPVPPTIVDCDMLRMYAKEAEFMQNIKMAEYYHKELLSREEHIALHWYEYGVFSLLKNDIENATQCFKRAVSLDQQFVPALLLYGMCCSLDEKCNRVDPNTGNTEAEEMMEMATTIDSSNLIAWTIRGLCYELLNKTLYRDMCFQEAQKLVVSSNEKTYITPLPKQQQPAAATQQQSSKEHEEVTENITSLSAASQEIEGGILKDTSAQELELTDQQQQQQSSTTDPHPPLTEQLPQVSEEHHISNISNHDKTTADHNSSNVNKNEKKKQEASLFLQTSSYLLDVFAIKYAEMCLAHENVLQSTQTNNTPIDSSSTAHCSVDFHVAVARLQIFKKDYQLAENHLHLAIKQDILNSNLLAILGHCHYESGDLDKAREYYERVVEYTTPPAHVVIVLLRLANVYMTHEEFLKAKQTYIRACRRGSSSETWKGVGIACYMLEQFSESEEALSEANLLNNLDPIIWAYLALVCYKTGRNQEATQAVNYAIKTGLNESSLIQQLQVIPCQ